ncbi:MAG TPA: NAD-dependent epimerase/dehydratase family protein [Planctomycetaceae bacterium]|jgi:nucleoside-diphosphate-sugar epimerase
MNRIAVLGASGFVGTTLVERLSNKAYDVRPFMNSGRDAWRLARLGIQIGRLNVLDYSEVERALGDCTHVVNCIMGDDRVMIDGLKNILRACGRLRVKRFVHLSSITAYGEPPPPDSIHEDAIPRPARGTYGWIKLSQDRIVQRSAARGLPCSILCPPIVSGPHSPQLLCLLDAIRLRKFALVDSGYAPCSLVDVENLAQAIELSLHTDSGPGRLFVVDDYCASWREVIDSIASVIGPWLPLPEISRAEAQRILASPERPRGSLLGTLRFLASRDTRTVLRRDPILASVESFASRMIRRIKPHDAGRGGRKPVRSNIHSALADSNSFDRLFLARQLRGVRHSSQRAQDRISYRPEVTFERSMSRFSAWHAEVSGQNDPNADLIAHLET